MAKTAMDYPVTFPYGATTDPYSEKHPHLGEDRSMSTGTPVAVNNQVIGLSGNSGHVEPKPTDANPNAGAHLHIQRVMEGNVVKPLGGGFALPAPVTVTDTGERADIGKYIRLRDANGEVWSYFHLSEIKVKVGDKIGEHVNEYPNNGDITNLWRRVYRREPNANDLAYWTKGTGNPKWKDGPAAVWKALGYELSGTADKTITQLEKAIEPKSVKLLAATRQFINENKE